MFQSFMSSSYIDWEIYSVILYQLVSNAINFSNSKGQVLIKLTLKPNKRQQSNSDIFGENDIYTLPSLVTEIIDNGPGIPEERQKCLFSAFSELQKRQMASMLQNTCGSQNARSILKTGLGLTQAKSLIQSCGGQILVKSCGEGTRIVFSVRLTKQRQTFTSRDLKEEIQRIDQGNEIRDEDFFDVSAEDFELCDVAHSSYDVMSSGAGLSQNTPSSNHNVIEWAEEVPAIGVNINVFVQQEERKSVDSNSEKSPQPPRHATSRNVPSCRNVESSHS